MQNKWQVYGFDTFANERYKVLPRHEFCDESEAREQVKTTLRSILKHQPNEESGDPDEEDSIQDFVILVHPDGTEELFSATHLQV